MSFVRFGTESAETVKALSRRAYPNAAPWVDPDDGEETTSAVGNALTYCDDDVCLELFSRWMNDLRTAGRMVNVGAEYYQRAMIHFRRGSLREAESDARTSWEILGPLRTVANHLHWRSAATLLQVLVGRGALDEAWSLTETTHLPTEPFESVITPWPPLVRGELALASGRTEEGIAILLAAGDWLEKRSFLNPSFVPWRALVAPALASVGRCEEAEAIIKPAVERARAFGAPWAYGMSLRAHGIVAQQDAGIGLLFAAVELLERSACRLELAYARLALGSKLRRANRRVEAREHLRIAVDLADRCGAPKVVASALQELASTGARPRRIPLSGTASLTASERRVAELAAGGLSNPEIAQRLFVSRKTVEAHLGSIYRKLDINSRQALGRVLADDPGAPA
jgi:DNA-binding CsgD family transcriptional regulator